MLDAPKQEPIPSRVQALHRYGSPNGAPRENLDRLSELAATVFDVPVALVTLVGTETQWFTGAYGTDRSEVSVEESFCACTIDSDEPLVVEDLTADDRFSDHRFVREEPEFRFYAGAPVCTSDGYRIGTVCVLDHEPRSPSEQDVRQLEHLAEMAMDALERHQFTVDDRPELSQTILDHLPGIFYVFGPDARLWRWNAQFEDRYGYDEDTLRGRSGTSFFDGADKERVARRIAEVFETGHSSVEAEFITGTGERVPMLLTGVRVRLAGEPHLVGMGIDISDQKQAEQALRRSEKKLRTVVENVQPAIFMIDRDGTVLLAEGGDLGALGGDPDEHVGSSAYEVFASYPRLTDCIDRALDGDVVDIDLEVNGRVFNSWFSSVRNDDGDVAGCIWTAADRTERRSARRELQRQKNLLQTVFENIPVMVAVLDEQGAFRLINEQMEDTLGWTEDEVAANPNLMDRLFPEAEDAHDVKQFVRDAPDEWREFDVRTKDGDRVPVRATAVKLEDGRRLGIGIDVRMEKRREKRLRLLEAALENSRVPVVIMEARDERPIVYANPAFTDVTGYAEDDIRGQSDEILFGPETDPAAIDRIQTALDDEEPVREIVKNYTKDGTSFWNDIYIAPVPNRNGEITHFVSIQADVTERVERREALREAKEEAEEADRIKAALLSNMNHEFRTPLTSVISFSELISKKPGLAEEFADRIRGGGRRLLRTLNTVMDFAELEGGQCSPAPEVFDLREAVETVTADFQPDVERTSLSLEVDEPDAPIMVVLDRHHVERICTHLVSNAMKFTDEGTVSVRVRTARGRVRIVVEDPGIGIDPAFRPDMFDEFAQASSGYDRTHEGNGLGLTIVKRLVELLNGSIAVESEPGVGTRVTVQLPEDMRT